MSPLAIYLVGGVVASVCVRAWQRAVIAGPEYAERRAHLEHCQFCEAPGWFWGAHGYSCVEWKTRRVARSPHDGWLGPWQVLWAGVFWPFLPLVIAHRRSSVWLTRCFADRVEREYIARRDAAEAERLIAQITKELP